MASAGNTRRRMGDRSVRQEFEAYKRKLDELIFYTEDFRENQMQITAKVVTNLDLLNVETKNIYVNKQQIDRVEAKVDGIEATLNSLLDYLGIEKKPVCECGKNTGLVMHRGVDATAPVHDSEVVKVPEKEFVDVGIQDEMIVTDFASQTMDLETVAVVATQTEEIPTDFEGIWEWNVSEGLWKDLSDKKIPYILSPDVYLPVSVGKAMLEFWMETIKFTSSELNYVLLHAVLRDEGACDTDLNYPLKMWIRVEGWNEENQMFEFDDPFTGGVWFDKAGNTSPFMSYNLYNPDSPPRLRLSFSPA